MAKIKENKNRNKNEINFYCITNLNQMKNEKII
jgi:hypothetical protein